MGSVPYALGRQLKFFNKVESAVGGAFGTASQETLAGSDAAKVTATDMAISVERANREDSSPTRSLIDRVTGKQDITWSAECYVLPAGGSTAPDCDPMLQAAFGSAFGGSIAKTYTLTDGTDELKSLHLARMATGVFREDIFGAWVESFGLSVSGGDMPKMSFSGGAMHYALTGTSTASAASSDNTDTTLPVQTGDGTNFMVGSPITIDGNDKIVTAVSGDVLTIASGHTWSNADAVAPTTQTETTAGSPIAGTQGFLTIDSVNVPITAFDVTMANGIKPIADTAFTSGATDFIPMSRSVTGSVSLRLRKDHLKYFSRRRTFATNNFQVQMGATAGSIVALYLPYVELDFSNISIPAVEEAVLNIPFTALGDGTGANEIKMAWNQG